MEYEPRVARCDRKHRDHLVAWSRRALVSVSESEVHNLGQELHLLHYSQSDRRAQIVGALHGYLRHVFVPCK